jgi:hypothetical protein
MGARSPRRVFSYPVWVVLSVACFVGRRVPSATDANDRRSTTRPQNSHVMSNSESNTHTMRSLWGCVQPGAHCDPVGGSTAKSRASSGCRSVLSACSACRLAIVRHLHPFGCRKTGRRDALARSTRIQACPATRAPVTRAHREGIPGADRTGVPTSPPTEWVAIHAGGDHR